MTKPLPDDARVEIDLPKGRLTVSGVAIAVILIIALLGMAYVSVRAIELGEHAIDHSASEQVIDP